MNFLRRLALQEKKKPWWQLTSRCCWNRARPWHASELVFFLVGLRTYQHLGIYLLVQTANRSQHFYWIALQDSKFSWKLRSSDLGHISSTHTGTKDKVHSPRRMQYSPMTTHVLATECFCLFICLHIKYILHHCLIPLTRFSLKTTKPAFVWQVL